MRLYRHPTPTLRCLLAAFLCISTSGALAEPINYQQVSLSAEARREIDNDLMTATLFIEQDDKDPARLADQINRKINEALALGKEFKTVKLRSSGRNTYPLYTAKNRADGWRSRADLSLESRDFAAASKLIGQLQSQLQLSGVGFSVSSEARDKAQNELITEAISAFRVRADIIAQGFGMKSWRVIQTQIGANDMNPMPMYKGAMVASRMDAMQVEVATPDMSGGSSSVSVTVSGTVEMLP
jgi:predicted secreted protein